MGPCSLPPQLSTKAARPLFNSHPPSSTSPQTWPRSRLGRAAAGMRHPFWAQCPAGRHGGRGRHPAGSAGHRSPGEHTAQPGCGGLPPLLDTQGNFAPCLQNPGRGAEVQGLSRARPASALLSPCQASPPGACAFRASHG